MAIAGCETRKERIEAFQRPLTASRRDKRQWLFDPFEWALRTGITGLVMLAFMVYNGDVSALGLAASAGFICLLETIFVGLGVWRLEKATKS